MVDPESWFKGAHLAALEQLALRVPNPWRAFWLTRADW
jgi:hypothetical protein